MNLVFVLLILCIGGIFVSIAVFTAIGSKRHRGAKRWLTAIGGILLALGGLGFFGTALSAVGGLNWLPASFEWPIGYARGIAVTRDGMHVVAHSPSGRIQVYDRDWKFVRGWHVEAGGGVFVLRVTSADQIEIMTARGRRRYFYGLDGSLRSQEGDVSQAYPNFPVSGMSAQVPTRWWLWMFTNPMHSWLVGAIGMVLLFSANRTKRKLHEPPAE